MYRIYQIIFKFKFIRKIFRAIKTKFFRVSDGINIFKMKREIDALYTLFYNQVHDLDNSLDFSSKQTKNAFSTQWDQFEEGLLLVDSDPWFKENCIKFLCEQEIQIKPEWFKGKNVLDAGCGNGRWAYALAKLGANYTAVDINEVALEKTKELIKDIDVKKEFIHSSLEDILDKLPEENKFDLVISWGVVHHVKRFNKALDNLTKLVKDDGILYLYLYGQESVPFNEELRIFKERVRYNNLNSDDERYNFLLKKSWGIKSRVHSNHDFFAPLINRRLDFNYVQDFLVSRGFENVVRTQKHPEVFVRAIKSNPEIYKEYILPPNKDAIWIEYYS